MTCIHFGGPVSRSGRDASPAWSRIFSNTFRSRACDERDHAHPSAAHGTGQRVDLEDLAEESSPCLPPFASTRWCCLVALGPARRRGVLRAALRAAANGIPPIIAHEMGARRRHLQREQRHERQRIVRLDYGSLAIMRHSSGQFARRQLVDRFGTDANPVFFKKQRLRVSTWNVPQFIFCGDEALLLKIGPLPEEGNCLRVGDASLRAKLSIPQPLNQLTSRVGSSTSMCFMLRPGRLMSTAWFKRHETLPSAAIHSFGGQ